METLTFRTNSKVKSLVGKELITNNNIAIFELIKNSYDAEATKVEIIFHDFSNINGHWESNKDSSIEIVDNGKGMTTDEIKEYWMELGKSSKEDNKVVRVNSGKMNKIIERFANGEKGIGRFGVDKIGESLTLNSIGIKDAIETKVFFDWNKYDDRTKLLQEIENEYETRVISSDNHGLSLTIANLREKWTGKEIESLKKNVSKFLSPNKVENDDFKIFFIFMDQDTEVDSYEIANDSFSYLRCKLEAHLNKNGVCSISIKKEGESPFEDRVLLYPGGSPMGEVYSEMYYLDRQDKNNFTRQMGIRTYDYGNIKVFRDSFRVMPYGEPHNDWLEIDKIHAQGIFRTFGTRDIVGNVFLSGKDISERNIFREATDRVGFIEDAPEFDILKEFQWGLIKQLEKYIFDQLRNDASEATEKVRQYTSEMKSDASETLNSFKKLVDTIDIEKPQKEILFKNIEKTSVDLFSKIDNVEKATNDIEKKIKIYSQMTYKEGILYEMLHSIKNKLSVIEAQIIHFERKLEKLDTDINVDILKKSYMDIQKLVDGALNKVNSSKMRKTNIHLENLINEVLDFQKDSLQENQIELVYSNQDQISDVVISCIPESVKGVFDNLFSNSVKALKGKKNARIKIEIEKTANQVFLYFSDNGVGVPEEKKTSLFTLWSSDTNGTGIGLASARDVVEDHGGEISYVDNNDDSVVTTFLIKLPRR